MASRALLYFISLEKVTSCVITTHYLLETHPPIQTPQAQLASPVRHSQSRVASQQQHPARLLPSPQNDASPCFSFFIFLSDLIQTVVSGYEKMILSGLTLYLEMALRQTLGFLQPRLHIDMCELIVSDGNNCDKGKVQQKAGEYIHFLVCHCVTSEKLLSLSEL